MAKEVWTIKRCLDWTRDYLRDKGDERPRLSAEWLLSGVTGLTRTEIYMSFEKPLSTDELSRMHAAVVRRAKGEPLQYIVGETSFRMIDVACEPGVLIPRPETELLVEEVLQFLDREVLGAPALRKRIELPWNDEVEAARRVEEAKRAEDDADDIGGGADDEAAVPPADAATMMRDVAAGGAGHAEGVDASDDETAVDDGSDAGPEGVASDEGRVARVLEVGCGTGCISLSIAREREGRVVCVATDIEPRAVALAARNRDVLGIEAAWVDIRQGNLVSPLDRETEWGTFDVLVSNPPYIPSQVMGSLPREVAAFEPALALDGGSDGLDVFRRLVKAAPHMLRPGGILACELFEGHLEQAASLCREAGMWDVQIKEDLAQRPRMLLARVGGTGAA